MLRLFIAVELPQRALEACAEMRKCVEAALGSLSPGVSFARPEGLHFTLKFLGATPDDFAERIGAGLRRAAIGLKPFAVTLGGLQTFPSTRKPRVIFIELTNGAAPMIQLASAIENEVAPLGFPTEKRNFTPHVTLARVKDLKNAPKIGERLAGLTTTGAIDSFQVSEVTLMESQLHPKGSKYTALARFQLGI